MDTKNLSLLFKTSLLAAAMSMVVGCSDNPVPTPGATTASLDAEVDSAVESSANTGTVITVADGLATDCTVKIGDQLAKEIDKTNAPGQYLLFGKAEDALEATGCKDAHTGADLPPMKAPKPDTTNSEGQDELNLTPLTTLVQGYIDAGSTPAQAKTRTAEFLGVPEADLEKNPVEEAANGNSALVKAAVKLTAISKTLEKGGNTDPIKALAAATKTKTATNDTLDKAIQDDTVINSVITDTTKRAEVKTASKAVNDAIDEKSSGQSGEDLLDTIAKVVKVIASKTNAELTNKETIKTESDNQSLNDAGKKVVKIEAGDEFFKKVVEAAKTEAKADPDKANFLPETIKAEVKAKVEEKNKIISGATAGN